MTRSLVGDVLAARRRRTTPTPPPVDKTPIPVAYTPKSGNNLSTLFTQPAGQESQMRAMGSVGTLFAIVNLLSTATAEVGWQLWRKLAPGADPDQPREAVASHLAANVWNRPNDFMTGQEFREISQQHLDLTGETWWVIGRDPRATLPLELWPVRPDRMAPVPSPTEYLVGYVYTSPSGETVPLGLDDVIFLRMPNPLDPYRGMGPVQSILADLDATRYSAEWNRNFFLNSAEPGGIIEVEKRLSDDEFREMTTRWREQHQGVAQAHRVAVLEQGRWVDRKFTQKDMQFAELRDVSRDVIREAFGVHKAMLGLADDVNRANAEAAETVFARWKIKPRCGRIKGALNADFLPLFGTPGKGVEFDFCDPVPENWEAENAELTAKSGAARNLVAAGWSRADAAAAVGLPEPTPIAGGADPVTSQAVANVVQKIYLGVQDNACLTWDEARRILNGAGAGLDLTLPKPVAAAAPAGAVVPSARLDRPRPFALPGPRAAAHPDLPESELPDVTPLQDDWETTLAELLAAWEGLAAAQKDQLVEDVRKIARDGSLADLAGLAVDTTDAAAALQQAMTGIAGQAADRLVEEAAGQGVTVKPKTPPDAELAAAAAAVAAMLGDGLALSARGAALRANGPAAAADDIAGAVREALDGLTDAMPELQLGGALTGAQNAARLATLAAAPSGAIYSSEVNDRNTCGPCRSVSGTWLGNTDDLDQVMAAYPGGAYGGYVGCQGRERCRGTITGVWRR